MSGSIYGYEQVKKGTKTECSENLITDNSFYSDDTTLTGALLDAILNNDDYEYYLKMYVLVR